MRILFVASYYKPAYIYGGPVRSVSALAEQLASLGHEVTIFTTNANGDVDLDVPTDKPVEVDGLLVHYFRRSSSLPGRYFYASDLGRACRTDVAKYDIVYISATWTYPYVAAGWSARHADVPYVVCPRGSFMEWSMGRKWLKKRIYLQLVERRFTEAASAIHCTSEMELEQIEQWKFKSPAVLIPNGVDLSPYQRLPSRGSLRQALRIPASAPVSLYVGRMHAMKRIDRTVEAFSSVVRTLPGAHLILVGPDEDGSGERARRWVTQHGLSDCVHFTGGLAGDQLLQAYVDSDLLVLLSHRENFGMVVVEAMAAGLPVLLSSNVGLASDVQNAGAGVVVDADSPQVETAWLGLLASQEQRNSMAGAARQIAQSRFSSEAAAQQMSDLFERIIARHRTRLAI